MSMSIKASPDGTYGEILVNGAVVAKLPVSGNAVIPGLVGTVSQSGGVPTGAIVERGSNANGDYVRFADGTQICMGIVTIPMAVANTHYSGSVAWAAAFTVLSTVQATINTTNAGPTAFYLYTGNSNTTNVMINSSANVTNTASIRYVGIGRWF